MARSRCCIVASALALSLAGCTHLGTGPAEHAGALNGDKDEKADKAPKTLLKWKLCKKDEKDKDKDHKKDEKDGKNGDDKKNGKEGKKGADDAYEPEEEKRIDTDRPHFDLGQSTPVLLEIANLHQRGP